ncbi:MAG: triose-phosphate isomerase [Olsenella sp.]|nr:triose-phosphate isomerase [Olsenella sp.]
MRNHVMAGNWKMNKTFSEAVELASGLAAELKGGVGDVDVIVAPPAVDLKGVAEVIEQSEAPFALGAQNVYFEESGAYTGETSPSMLESVGATYCIIGHSERRGYFGETDEDVNKKAKKLMEHGIVPISCCGESLEVREAGKHVEFVCDQVRRDTEGLDLSDPSKYIIAYEPIWAIGTGKTATADDAEEVCGAIRRTLAEVFGQETADGVRILYGGSAKPGNVGGFLEKDDVDGALVGGASLKADSFAEMVRAAM